MLWYPCYDAVGRSAGTVTGPSGIVCDELGD